jgi:hypothetical protein
MQGQDGRLESLSNRLESLRAEMIERFTSVDRIRTLELRMTLFENRVNDRLELIAAEVAGVRGEPALPGRERPARGD